MTSKQVLNSTHLKILKQIEWALLLLVLTYDANAWWHVQVIDTIEQDFVVPFEEYKALGRLINYAIILIFMIIYREKIVYASTRNKLLLISMAIVFCSFIWSVDPTNTIEGFQSLIRTTVLGAIIAARFSIKEQVRLFAWSFGILAIASWIFCLFIPNQGIQLSWKGIEGWRGVFFHKNQLGRFMVTGSGLFLLFALTTRKHKFWLWLLFILCFALVVLSNSKTALLSFFITLVIFPLKTFLVNKDYNLRMVIIHGSLLCTSFLAMILISFADPIFALIGKDATLTGRVPCGLC
ncbi:MAG: hypothetical protein HC796_10645 [Synechococcaceae cyanobacterium RL_1_2]|nr:hypothetical protein [Synechococcaceae cyanobacterium RL_1_2]